MLRIPVYEETQIADCYEALDLINVTACSPYWKVRNLKNDFALYFSSLATQLILDKLNWVKENISRVRAASIPCDRVVNFLLESNCCTSAHPIKLQDSDQSKVTQRVSSDLKIVAFDKFSVLNWQLPISLHNIDITFPSFEHVTVIVAIECSCIH